MSQCISVARSQHVPIAKTQNGLINDQLSEKSYNCVRGAEKGGVFKSCEVRCQFVWTKVLNSNPGWFAFLNQVQ